MTIKQQHKPIKTLREAERWIREHAGSLYMGHGSDYKWEAATVVNGGMRTAHGKSATGAVDRLVWKLERE